MGKKRKSIRNGKSSSGVEEFVKVPIYAPNLGLRPEQYQKISELTEFEESFDKRCAEFLKTANPDQCNGTYMDAEIDHICDKAIASLSYQYVNHLNLINTLLKRVWRGDRIKGEAKLAWTLNERHEVERELIKLQAIYWKDTSLEEVKE